MKPCPVPFCDNPLYFKKKSYGYCLPHLYERQRFKVKAYKEVLPIWAVFRCKVHGLLKDHEVYKKKNAPQISCKLCTKSYMNSIYDPEKAKIANAKKANQKRNRELKCLYGITLNQYHEILKSQNHSCAICETNQTDSKNGGFRVDHCHETKIVRGILCHSCNVGIGFLKDKVEILERAILYLKKSYSNSVS